MTPSLRKIRKYKLLLDECRYASKTEVTAITMCPSSYKTSQTLPELSAFLPFENGGKWGHGKDSHAWFHLTLENVKAGTELLVFTDKSGWDADNPQFMAYVNGSLRQGLDTNHKELRMDVGVNDVYLYGYTGPKLTEALLFLTIAVPDPDVTALCYDIQYPLEILEYLDPESGEYAEILKYLHQAVSLIDLTDPESFSSSVRAAKSYLEKEFYESYCGPQKASVACIGHTHIDCAWLWTLKQTREKVQRSFATVLELMKRYPEYRFMSSQAFLYQNLKEEAPELYQEVGERIQEGRWEAEGSMWVEADCNLSSGESLVRQILYGKRFFREEFGVENHILWLPDVFGYSAALPQILKKSGIDWFLTSKISWNDTNKLPYDTFVWKGIDGSSVNAYFLTAQKDNGTPSENRTTYNAHPNAPMLSGTYKRYQQKHLSNEVLLTFGYGDGGGGPTVEDLELLRRAACGVPGAPIAKISTAGEFLNRLGEKISADPYLPVWQGELYLEFHRGTYTSQAKNKRNNRKAEFLLQNAELLSSISTALFDTAFPHAELKNGWEILLTNQFHDIIPGSSIHEVYEQCERDYAEVFSIGEQIVSAAGKYLAGAIQRETGYIVFNPNGFREAGLVCIDGKTVLTPPVASKGYSVLNHFVSENHVSISDKIVETDCFSVTFNSCWQIVSLYDKENDREVLKPDSVGNELRLYADYPDTYDAWEWQSYSCDSHHTINDFSSVTTVDDGVRRGIQIVRPFGKSLLTETIWFYDKIRRIDFETEVDWHERHQMLKAAFPVDIQTDKALFEIQFGRIERPTHFNTSWDQARFETCAHKYADLSDSGYGVSLINDCKYGHDIHDGVIEISLLRSPTYPDPEADQGHHHFMYSVAPHRGTLSECETVRFAYELNNPLTAWLATGTETTIPTEYSAAECTAKNVIIETIKAAEDGIGTIIRLYECANQRTRATLKFGLPASKVFLCDLLENELEELPFVNGTIDYMFRNFEIVTLKLR